MVRTIVVKGRRRALDPSRTHVPSTLVVNRLLAAALAVAALGCSDNAVPSTVTTGMDAATPPDDIAVFQRPDALPIRPPDVVCGGLAVPLTRRNATVILVIDRSGSMGDPTTDMRVKWDALREALQMALPRLGRDVAVGLTLFPGLVEPPDSGALGPAQVCTVPTALALEPAPRQVPLVLQRLMLTTPGGPTPTAASLALVRTWYAEHPDLTGERYVILATDGGPNCNLMADPATCRCTGPSRLCDPMMNSFARINCLDEMPALNEVRQLGAMGVRTFVIGLNGTQDFADVLNRMADAGGRARPGAAHYYPAASAVELTRELGDITVALADCTLRLTMPPVDPDLVDVRLDGVSLYRDPRHMNGWDWGDESHHQIVFYGAMCDVVRTASGGSQLAATFGCPAPAPP